MTLYSGRGSRQTAAMSCRLPPCALRVTLCRYRSNTVRARFAPRGRPLALGTSRRQGAEDPGGTVALLEQSDTREGCSAMLGGQWGARTERRGHSGTRVTGYQDILYGIIPGLFGCGDLNASSSPAPDRLPQVP